METSFLNRFSQSNLDIHLWFNQTATIMNRLLLPIAFLAVIFSSCQKKHACDDVVCLNNGICESGDCLCEAGYEGPNCETEQRLVFVNAYSVTESCNLGNFTYEVSVNADSESANEITITNFGDFGYSVTALVDGLNFEILSQIHSGDTIVGNGFMTDSVISIEYSLISTQADSLMCTMVCTP